ncbi:MAG: amidohydrolase [Ignavibacteria bacterium]|nr:amidohydrolase [Ignavibacteria bacterium]
MSTQTIYFLAFFLLSILCVLLFFWLIPQSADTVYVNARIYTMDRANTVAEAMAVRGDRIVSVGSTKDLQRRFESQRVVDLEGKTVLPGLIDAHVHLLSFGVSKLTLNVSGTKSEAQIADMVRDRAATSDRGQWIRGRGWDQNSWASKRFPTRDLLDRASPGNPVYLIRIDGHAAWANSLALTIAGITIDTPDPPGGKIVRDARGSPTGILIDNAMDLVGEFLPPPSDNELKEAVRLAIRDFLMCGITCVHDMGIEAREIELYKQLIDADEFPFRVYAAIESASPTWSLYNGSDSAGKKRAPFVGYGGNKLWVRAVKVYVDGALGSRGAALLEPYSDDPMNRGLTVTTEDALRSVVDDALANGFQVCTHAIGDRANNIILNVYENALKARSVPNHRFRLEHAQVLAPSDIPRLKKLGVIPSMQPTHCTSDMYWAEARLGHSRILGAYAWRSLLDTGVIIPGGSDCPVENPNPLFGIYAAITRRDWLGRPKDARDIAEFFQLSERGIVDPIAFDGGWYASQRMKRDEALRAFTTWAAYAGFQESVLGSLERGKLADFIVLSRDITAIDPMDILTTVVEQTFVGGEVVYSR